MPGLIKKEEKNMTLTSFIINTVLGVGLYMVANLFARFIYKKRFGEQLFNGKKGVVIQLISIVLSGLMMDALGIYGFSLISRVSLVTLAATALLIGRIDRNKMIIPNEMILALLVIRVISLFGEMFIDNNPVGITLFDTLAGIFAATAIFLMARLFSKGCVGMGDIKLLAVVGMYVGVGTILPLLIVTVFSSLIYSVIMIAKKTISKKDTMSFAPFIAAGIVTVVLMGI